MRLIYDRYLFKSLIYQLLMWSFFATVLFLLGIFLEKLDDFMMYKATSPQILFYLFEQFPYWLWRSLPLAFLGSSLSILDRANRTGELVALESLGCSPFKIYRSLMLGALILAGVGLLVFENKAPLAYRAGRQYLKTNIAKDFSELKDFENFIAKGSEGRYFVFGSLHLKEGSFSNFWLDEWEGLTHKREIFSTGGRYDEARALWLFENASVVTYGVSRDLNLAQPSDLKVFDNLQIRLSDTLSSLMPKSQRLEEMTLDELKEAAINLQQRGITQRKLIAEHESRRLGPLSFIVLLLVAMTVVTKLPEKHFKGNMLLFGITIVVGIFYWFCVGLTKTLATHGLISSAVGAWSPHILLSLVALSLRK